MMTLKQISYITGFSTSTVSKALNDRLDISVETRKFIQDIASKNNYVPNKNAIALRKNKSNIVAVILPQINEKWYSNTLCEIQKKAATSGYRVMLFQSFAEAAKEEAFLDDINDGSIDAAMVFSAHQKKIKERFNSIPIEFIHTLKAQSQEDFINLSMKSFQKLLAII